MRPNEAERLSIMLTMPGRTLSNRLLRAPSNSKAEGASGLRMPLAAQARPKSPICNDVLDAAQHRAWTGEGVAFAGALLSAGADEFCLRCISKPARC